MRKLKFYLTSNGYVVYILNNLIYIHERELDFGVLK